MSALKKLNWQKWLYIGENEALTEQGYWNSKRANHQLNEHSLGVVSGLEVSEDAPVSTKVDVATGRAVDAAGREVTLEAVQEVDLNGLIGVVYITLEFAEAGSDPYYIPELGSYQNKYKTDSFTLLASTLAPSGNQIELARVNHSGGAATISDPTNPDNPGNDEIDQTNRLSSAAPGLKLRKEVSGDAALSTVTVGEIGCDYRDIASALSYVNGLTRSKLRQCTILVFPRRNGQEYRPAAAMTVPTYTHLIGMGKPAIDFSGVVAANLITMDTGSELKNLWIEVDDTWTDTVIDMNGDCVLDNVTMRYEHNSTKALYMVDVIGGYCKIVDLTIRGFSGDSTKSAFGLVVNGTYCEVERCYIITFNDPMSVAGSRCKLHALHLTLTTATSYTLSVSGSYLQADNVTLDGAATRGLYAGGDRGNYVNFFITSSYATFRAIHVAGVRNAFTSMRVEDGRVTASSSYCLFTGCHFKYTNAEAVALVEVGIGGNNTVFTGCSMDRGANNEPCIEATNAGADYCIVTGCMLLLTNGVACVLGMAGANRWLVHGNTHDTAAEAPAAGGGGNWNIQDNWPMA